MIGDVGKVGRRCGKAGLRTIPECIPVAIVLTITLFRSFYSHSRKLTTKFYVVETPLLKKRLFPPHPLPLKTSDAVITDWLNQSVITAFKSSLKGVWGEAFFQESSPHIIRQKISLQIYWDYYIYPQGWKLFKTGDCSHIMITL